MLYPTETLDLLPPVEQIDAHLKHQKSIFRPRADGFLKEKAERKVREMACSSRFSDFRVWQGQKDLNPRHAVLEAMEKAQKRVKQAVFEPFFRY